jgi:mannosyl-3-phosphoglycerate phosphatase
MIVIFTDLDGTLLEADSYSAEEAKPALELMSDLRVPVIICTSKTRAEVEVWRLELQNAAPFIVENGGALFIPSGYFPFMIPPALQRESYDVIEFGTPYLHLVESLRLASEESGCAVIGFHDMSVGEVSRRCGISAAQAVLAKQREYDEPFEILGNNREDLLRAISGRGKRWTRGGRFYHLTGTNEKADAVRLLAGCYRRVRQNLITVGLGDGLNDANFLNAVDVPILMPSDQIDNLKEAVPRGLVAREAGPAGWNSAVLGIIEKYRSFLPEPADRD